MCHPSLDMGSFLSCLQMNTVFSSHDNEIPGHLSRVLLNSSHFLLGCTITCIVSHVKEEKKGPFIRERCRSLQLTLKTESGQANRKHQSGPKTKPGFGAVMMAQMAGYTCITDAVSLTMQGPWLGEGALHGMAHMGCTLGHERRAWIELQPDWVWLSLTPWPLIPALVTATGPQNVTKMVHSTDNWYNKYTSDTTGSKVFHSPWVLEPSFLSKHWWSGGLALH